VSADREIRAAKIDRGRKARSSRRVTRNENCCPKLPPPKFRDCRNGTAAIDSTAESY